MIVVISPPTSIAKEFQILHQLFEQGLEFFQLYKPSFSAQEIKQYVEGIHESNRHKVSLHSDQLKFHSLEEIEQYSVQYDYAFLSPIFNSISKKGYNSPFDLEVVKDFLQNRQEKIIALGGVDDDKIETVKTTGFDGVALLGAIWESEDPIGKFNRISEQWQN
jgi:thiamine-phosphate pyrophosphorylase